ncbi:MAG: hypothetical protein QM564_09855 [Bergeyella sp.]
MEIIIDPRLKINYSSWYIKGLFDLTRKKAIKFSEITHTEDLYSNKQDYEKGMTFIISKNGKQTKIFIDFHDGNSISVKHYEWCDIYAKINLTESDMLAYPKTMPIGPSFGIDILSIGLLCKIGLALIRTDTKPVSYKEYIRDFLFLKIRRKKYETYLNAKSKEDYIFTISTLWYDHLTANTTNKFRGEFVKNAKKIFQKFEGGFFFIEGKQVEDEFPGYRNYLEQYKDFIYTKRISPKEYIDKTKDSSLVFNTPSVGGCHGWKLAEYLAMGKAIISTPLNNLMPSTHTHTHTREIDGAMLVINDVKSLEQEMLRLKNDMNFRKNLERAATRYFHSYLAPKKVVQRIVEKC